MGVRHSKPKTKRRFRSKSIGKRQNPEGGYSEDSSAVQGSHPKTTPSCTGTCPCNKPLYDVTEEGRSCLTLSECKTDPAWKTPDISAPYECRKNDVETKHFEHYPNEILKVGLPSESTGLTSSHLNQPSKIRPKTSTTAITQSRNQSEWTITLGGDKTREENPEKEEEGAKDDVKQEEISRLMTSIRELINHEVGSWATGHSQVHVHLSVSPSGEPGTSGHSRVPATESVTSLELNSTSHNSKKSCENEPPQIIHSVAPHREENIDRRQHYRLIPGLDSSDPCTTTKDNDAKVTPSRERTVKRAPSSGKDGSRSCSRDRTKRCQCRRHSKRSHADRSRGNYQSPFDQGFKEAMYLRLKELQLKTGQQAAIARRAAGVDDVTDDVIKKRDASGVTTESDSEYSGDENGGGVLSGTQDTRKQVSRMFEPLSEEAIRAMSGVRTRDSASATHRQIHGSTDTFTACEANLGDETVDKKTRSCSLPSGVVLLKPWNRTEVSTVKKKKTKTRKKKKGAHEINSRPPHGYLRANTMPPGAICKFPNTPQVGDRTGGTGKAPALVPQRHQHEHYHHHYYYQCEQET